MPRVTGVRRDRRLNGKGSKGQGPNGQCKASINPAAAASLSAANWQRECEKASALLGPSAVPVVLSFELRNARKSFIGPHLLRRLLRKQCDLGIALLQHSVRIQNEAMHCHQLARIAIAFSGVALRSILRAGRTEAVDSPLHCFSPKPWRWSGGASSLARACDLV